MKYTQQFLVVRVLCGDLFFRLHPSSAWTVRYYYSSWVHWLQACGTYFCPNNPISNNIPKG